MTDTEPTKEEVESGAYYRSARAWYSELHHTPIAERSYYIVVILLAFINVYFAINSFMEVFPIRPQVPFVTYSSDIWEDLPLIKRLATNGVEDKNVAVMKFLLRNYVISRESYDLSQYEVRYRSIWSQSSPDVFTQYKQWMDATNPYSPYRLYTNRAKRVIRIVGFDYTRGKDTSQARIVFDDSVQVTTDNQELRHSRWQAEITYKYTDFQVDQSLDQNNWIARVFGLTGHAPDVSGEKRRVVPMTFIVSGYNVKEILE